MRRRISRARLALFYTKHNPPKAAKVDSFLAKYSDEYIVSQLRSKYGATEEELRQLLDGGREGAETAAEPDPKRRRVAPAGQ